MAVIIFSPGDVVRLKSGGPPMTVNTLRGDDDIISCEWFAGDILRRDAFDRCNLIHCQPVPVLATA